MLSVLQQILVWGIILTIAVLYFKPIVLCFLLVRKNNAGLPLSTDLAGVEALLRRHPWKEKQELELLYAETEVPYLYLPGYYTDIRLRTKDSSLIGQSGASKLYWKDNSKPTNPIWTLLASSRRGYWEAYEANQLLRYISLLSEDENSEDAVKLREQTQSKLDGKKVRDKARKWLERIIIFAGIVVIVSVLLYAKGKAETPSSLIKNMVFSDFHYTKTVGSALNSFDPDGEWFDVSEKNALKNDGAAYAGWRGTCQSSSILGQTENWPITIYFEIRETDADDQYYVSVDRIEFGQYSLSSSKVFQSATIWDIMNMIYGNQENVSVAADTGLFNMTYFLRKKADNSSPVSQDTPSPAPITQPTPVPALSPEPTTVGDTANGEDRSTWEYEDYVDYYGIDPADYGFMWFNEIKSGPLDEFFDGTIEAINGEANASRLYEIDDPWQADLTPDDLVGTWQTESGIIFTIDNIDGTYTIDLSENEGLNILGGMFSEDLYDVEGAFGGMAGSNGAASFSVTYEYSTESPETNTWLRLELMDSEGTTVEDRVPLISH